MLTTRQSEVLAAIRRLTSERGFPPTRRELAAAVGVSRARLKVILDRLVKLEVIEVDCGTSRAIRLNHPSE